MLDIQVKIEGYKVIIEGLDKIAQEMPRAITRGLIRSAKGIHSEAMYWLGGAGAKGISKEVTDKKYLKWNKQSIPAGGYIVPVRTGHLRRSLDWLKPGESKTGDAGTFAAGANEVVIFDSAVYANVIYEGKGSSAKYGPRRFLTDGLQKFNQGDRLKKILEEEIQKAKNEAGLK